MLDRLRYFHSAGFAFPRQKYLLPRAPEPEGPEASAIPNAVVKPNIGVEECHGGGGPGTKPECEGLRCLPVTWTFLNQQILKSCILSELLARMLCVTGWRESSPWACLASELLSLEDWNVRSSICTFTFRVVSTYMYTLLNVVLSGGWKSHS